MPTHVISANGTEADPTTGNVPVELVVYQLKTVLTDAQIKALGTTLFELVPAPGAGKMIMLHSCAGATKFTSVYTNLDPADTSMSPKLVLGSADLVISTDADAEWLFKDDATPGFFLIHQVPSLNDALSVFENKALYLYYHNIPGDFTGGDPANTLEVTVFYSIVDL